MKSMMCGEYVENFSMFSLPVCLYHRGFGFSTTFVYFFLLIMNT